MANEKQPPKTGHTLEDHHLGEGLYREHEHGPDADHDHDDFTPGPLEENAIWLQDNVWLVSVGIDIGSAGTQVIFSRLHLRRLGEELSSRYYVVSRETLFQSPVAFTPYRIVEVSSSSPRDIGRAERIDEQALGTIIDEAYAAAGIAPDEVDTGVVILTGEALRRENAEAVANVLAEHGGDFVCTTAGHHMEAMLAAYGSGAARVSHDTGKRLLNIDIGGGTTKLAVLEGGRVVTTAAIHIGGRLQVVDPAGRIVRLDPAGRMVAAEASFNWKPGDHAPPEEMAHLAGWMADTLIAAVRGRLAPALAEKLYLTEPIRELGRIDGIMISGGVGEFVYGRETRDFGDMGRLLGRALRGRIDAGALAWPLLPPGECIRATALGASEYSVQLSGSTIYVSDPRALLPHRNLQVLRPRFDGSGEIDPDGLAIAIRDEFSRFDLKEGESDAALAFRWSGAPSYARLSAFASGLAKGLSKTIAAHRRLYVVLDGDVAQMLGAILKEEMGVASPVLVIDGIVLHEFDFVDLGRIRMPSFTVPITIKSLVFNDHHLHHHHHGHAHDRARGHRHSHG
jgi:ethanolamine utilization protein EutA